MKKARLFAALLVLFFVSALLQREFARGTFDPVERAFVGWLSANSHPDAALPPLALVLYDEESSALSGAQRMGGLDAALFARAASKLGAFAAGIEGLTGDPARMIEAAGRLPLFAGYSVDDAPGTGWTPWAGAAETRWPELPGLVGPSSTRLPRGFFAAPEGSAGPCTLALVARNSGRPVPSFLALAWSVAQKNRSALPTADSGWLRLGERSLPLDANGRASFFPAEPAKIMSMNELLVATEKYEREGGAAPLRGNIVVLARATAEVARLKGSSDGVVTTPAELWARAWPALRQGRFFVLPGWLYQVVLIAVGLVLCLGSGQRCWNVLLGTSAAVLLVFLLAALGLFASYGVLLPFVPSLGTLIAAVFLGRFISRL